MAASSPPARILYVITDFDRGGGAEEALFQTLKRLDREKFTPEVVVLKGSGNREADLHAIGVPVRFLGLKKWMPFSGMKELKKVVRENPPEILHTILFHANLAGRLVVKGEKPIIISSIRVAERERSRHLTLDRWTQKKVTLNLCVSQAVARFTMEEVGVPAEKIAVIPNGVETNLNPTSMPWTEPYTVVAMGRLVKQKGFDVLIEAALGLRVQKVPCRFLIAGEGPEEAALREQIRIGKASEYIQLVGFQEAAPFLQQSDLFVLSSRWEGMPNVVLHAMAEARPVVATDVEGVSELVDPGKTGWIVPPEDQVSLGNSIRDALSDRTRAEAYGKAGHQKVAADFTWDGSVKRLEGIYQRLLGRSG